MRKALFFIFLGILTLEAKSTPDTGVNLLEQTSLAFTHIADKAMPATVFIKTQISQKPSGSFGMQEEDLFRRFFGPNFQIPDNQPQTAGGSGFLVSADGYIVTNHHVIKDASEITVILNDDREYSAVVKGVDPRTDLALVKIEEKNLSHLLFGDSDKLRVGEWVAATGNPFGMEATLTVGVVSAKGRQDIGIASYEDFIQTDAAINPGNSGGPLLNLQGEVIGVNTAILSRSGGYMGIGLSIPSKMAKHVIDQLMANGGVKRAYLGVILQPIDKDLSTALNLDKQEGILISEVVKDSPASKAGLENGDIITQYNDKPVKNVAKFRNEIAMLSPGTKINLQILRNSKKKTISATLGDQSDSEIISTEMIQKIGLQIENLSPEMATKLGYASDTEGVLISNVKPGSPAAKAGIRPSFVITGMAFSQSSQKRVKNITDLEEALKDLGDKKHIILIVRHHNYQRYYTVNIN